MSVCVVYWLGPGKGKEAETHKNDFDESHDEEEIRCSEYLGVSSDYYQYCAPYCG